MGLVFKIVRRIFYSPRSPQPKLPTHGEELCLFFSYLPHIGPSTDAYFLVSFPVTGFPCGSASKESACNAGSLGLIPGLRRSPGEGKGYPLQYSGLRIPWTVYPWGCKGSDTTERLSLHFTSPMTGSRSLWLANTEHYHGT